MMNRMAPSVGSTTLLVSMALVFWCAGSTAGQQVPNMDYSSSVLLCRSDVSSSVSAADLDGDGDLDLVYGNGRHYPKQSLIYLNDGGGAFHGEYPLFSIPRKTYDVALADLDGDGDVDAVAGTDFGDYKQVFWNAGNGTFKAGPLLEWEAGLGGRELAVRAVVVSDLDDDGAPDIVMAGRESPDLVFWNESDGRWTATRLGEEPGASIAVAVADLDLDGDPDIVIGRRGANALFLNQGSRQFRATMPWADIHETTAVAIADLDGRNGPDIVFGNEGTWNRILWNDGNGRFERTTAFGTGGDQTRAIRPGDADGDGDLDLFVGNLQRGFRMLGDAAWALPILDQPNRVYINDGAGGFVAGPTFGQPGSQTRGLAVADFDGDGRVDVAEANDCGTNAVHLGARQEKAP